MLGIKVWEKPGLEISPRETSLKTDDTVTIFSDGASIWISSARDGWPLLLGSGDPPYPLEDLEIRGIEDFDRIDPDLKVPTQMIKQLLRFGGTDTELIPSDTPQTATLRVL